MEARAYKTTPADRAKRMKDKIDALEAEKKRQVADALRQLQQNQVDDICGILERSGISDVRNDITTIEDVNDLFKNLGLSGGRKSRRRKPRKSMKSRRRRY